MNLNVCYWTQIICLLFVFRDCIISSNTVVKKISLFPTFFFVYRTLILSASLNFDVSYDIESTIIFKCFKPSRVLSLRFLFIIHAFPSLNLEGYYKHTDFVESSKTTEPF